VIKSEITITFALISFLSFFLVERDIDFALGFAHSSSGANQISSTKVQQTIRITSLVIIFPARLIHQRSVQMHSDHPKDTAPGDCARTTWSSALRSQSHDVAAVAAASLLLASWAEPRGAIRS
jgi:hypothetical protein